MLKIKNKTKNRGFALLFSVLISSLLLTIGLSIFSIALKELSIATATQRSLHAFYASDSGREYAIWSDVIEGKKYFDQTKDLQQTTNIVLSNNPTFVKGKDGPNYYVTIIKKWHDASETRIDTTVISTGHDSVGSDRVEREIQQGY